MNQADELNQVYDHMDELEADLREDLQKTKRALRSYQITGWLAVGLTGLLVAIMGTVVVPAMSPADCTTLYEKVRAASVKIKTSRGFSSGVAVTGLGHGTVILAAGHCCHGEADQVELVTVSKGGVNSPPSGGKIIFRKCDRYDLDCLVIRPDKPELFSPVEFRPIRACCVRLGEPLVVAGRIDGDVLGLSLGQYRGRDQANPLNPRAMMMNLNGVPGCSGSGVFIIRNGALYYAGTLNWGTEDVAGAFFFMPVDDLLEALNPLGL